MDPDVNPRQRNRRGQGRLLRGEILTAAAALLTESGSEDAVTLRAVARRAGIAAPSIYSHFTDREAILEELIRRGFDELTAAVRAAADADPARPLRAACRAYLDFATANPAGYRLLFDRRRRADSRLTDPRPAAELLGADAFGTLVRLIARPGAAHGDAERDAAALWVALHGYATLRQSVPAFPWPDDEQMLTMLIDRIVQGPQVPAT